MKDGHKRNRCTASVFFRHMLLGERSDFLFFSESMRTLADIAQGADVVIGKIAVQHEAAQGISLPGRTGPVSKEWTLEEARGRVTRYWHERAEEVQPGVQGGRGQAGGGGRWGCLLYTSPSPRDRT